MTLDCGHPPSEHGPHTTGYGTDRDTGATACYECTTVRDLATMREAAPGDRFGAYLSSDGRMLTNWPGGKLGSVTIGNPHPWSSERTYIRVVDAHGGRWYGTGAPGMWASLRRCRA